MPVIAIDVWEHAFFGIDFNPTQDKLRGAIVVAITVDPSNPSGNTVYFRGRVSGNADIDFTSAGFFDPWPSGS